MTVSKLGRAEATALAAIPPIEVPEGLATPAAFIDLDVLDANIIRMQSFAVQAGVRLRPHVKTHKSINIGDRQRRAGARGVTVGTLREAQVFADAGFDDIFLAVTVYASTDNAAVMRDLHERITFRAGIDTVAGAEVLAAAFGGASRPFEVLVEVDSGEHRTGVRPAEVAAIATAAARAGLAVVGAFTHGGHGYESRAARKPAAQDEVRGLEMARRELEAAGFEIQILSAGSTPTVTYSSLAPVTEQRPGTYPLNDAGQVALGTCAPTDVALRVASTVISDSVPGQVIIDAGTKAIGREPAEYLDGFGWMPELPGSHLHTVNDYHGFVAVDPDSPPAVGSRLTVVPNHVCPVVNLYDELYVVQAGKVIDTWPVDARGH